MSSRSKRRRDDDRSRRRRSKSGSRSKSRSRSASGSRSPVRRRERKQDEKKQIRKEEDKQPEVVNVHEKKRKRRRWDDATPEGPDAAAAMAQAQAMERTRALKGESNALASAAALKASSGLLGIGPGAPAIGSARSQAVSSALEKAKEAARIQRQIQERLQGLGISNLAGMAPSRQWAPLVLDKQGRQVDSSGNVIVMQRNVDTLKYNINQQIAKFDRNVDAPTAAGGARHVPTKPKRSHIDPNLNVQPMERAKRDFRFVKPGKYLAKATQMRMKQISREMRLNKREAMDDTYRQPVQLDPIPDVEWWDEKILQEPSYDSTLDDEAITSYIHHPVELKPLAELPPPPPMELMLTAKERKKIQRRNKMEKQKEEQDKIRLGLMKAPEPKMRLANLMRVLGQDAIMEPSKIEAKVRKQMAARQKAHEKHNEARQLTPEQKREKKRAKLKEDTSIQVHVAVFRAGDLADSKRRYKVDINARQQHLTGCCVLYGNCNVVVAEGGPKGIKFFKRLMLHRIKWEDDLLSAAPEPEEEEPDSDDEEAEPKPKAFGKCVLVWEGVLAKRSFKQFLFESCRSEVMARKVLKSKGVEHYWDMCRNYRDLQEHL